MKITQKYGNLTDCTEIKAAQSIYPLWEAAALWCGVDSDKLPLVQEELKSLGKGIYSHNDIPCIEFRMRAFAEAIESGELDVYRENGGAVPPEDHVAYERRHLKGKDLKKWIAEKYPNDKPRFLFDEVEVNMHTGIKVEDYLALTAEKENLQARLDKAISVFKQQKNEIEELKLQIESLNKTTQPASAKTLNKQNEVIAALALVALRGGYIGVPDKGHFEAAETLLQSFDLYLPKYGIVNKKVASKDTLAGYINEGVLRLKE